MDIVNSTEAVNKKKSLLPYISYLVREQRLELGFSQEELARVIGIGLKTLRKIEQGELNVNFQTLNHLLNFFGMGLTPAELISSPPRKHNKILKKEEILRIMTSSLAILKLKYGVTELALFGSYAKEQATAESDIDILIEFESDISLETEGEIQLILENLLDGIKVDLTFKKNLHSSFKNEIEETKIDVKEKL